MKTFPTLARALGTVAVLLISGCASNSRRPGGDRGMPPWPPGTYDLLATVTYRFDSETGTRNERMEHRAELVVAPDESLTLSSSSGLCTRQTPDELERDIARGIRSFSCQEARYVLRPAGGTVGGSVTITVQEGIRTRGPCDHWEDTAGGGRVCAQYTWYVDYRTRSQQANLRVLRR